MCVYVCIHIYIYDFNVVLFNYEKSYYYTVNIQKVLTIYMPMHTGKVICIET